MAHITIELPALSREHIQETTDKLLFLRCTSRNMGFTMWDFAAVSVCLLWRLSVMRAAC